jgi:hypothetical protein
MSKLVITYQAKMKWDGVHSLLKGGFDNMEDANDWINDEIEKGNLRPVESEFREYYILPVEKPTLSEYRTILAKAFEKSHFELNGEEYEIDELFNEVERDYSVEDAERLKYDFDYKV